MLGCKSNRREDTVGIWKVSQGDLEAFETLFSYIDEQCEIGRCLAPAIAWLDRVAAEHANISRTLPKLDHAILAKIRELTPSDCHPHTLDGAAS
jgi:hypothetical protein